MITSRLSTIALVTLALAACTQPTAVEITNFDECVAAGNPVMESYPRQCSANGQTFVEEIDNTDESNVRVDSPQPMATVSSPLTVTGEARGTWYFEASFPVRLFDGNGNEIAVAPAQAQGDWMTTDFVPFAVTLTFDPPSTTTGTLIMEKDNPSGLPEHAASVSIPVTF